MSYAATAVLVWLASALAAAQPLPPPSPDALAATITKAAIGVLVAQLVIGAGVLIGFLHVGKRFISVEFPAFRAEISGRFEEQHLDLVALRTAVEDLKVGAGRLDETDTHFERRLASLEDEMRELRRRS